MFIEILLGERQNIIKQNDPSFPGNLFFSCDIKMIQPLKILQKLQGHEAVG